MESISFDIDAIYRHWYDNRLDKFIDPKDNSLLPNNNS